MTTPQTTTAARCARAPRNNFADAIASISRYCNVSRPLPTLAHKEHHVPWHNHLRKITCIA